MSSAISINLIKSKTNLIDEIVKWSLTVGRLLIIVVEIIAFSTFIYRFSLDRTLVDLHDEIIQQQAIVENLSERELTYRNFQERIKLASSIHETGNENLKTLNHIASITPSNVKFNSISIDGKEIKIDADTTSLSEMSNFLKLLRDYEKISSAGINTITNNKSGAINVSLTAILK